MSVLLYIYDPSELVTEGCRRGPVHKAEVNPT